MKEFICINKNKIFYFISIILILMLFYKTSFLKNLINISKNNENKRITKLYGYCGNESIGYLKYLKKKYNIKSNPKIINYTHTPPVNWSIYETASQDVDPTKLIILNYPGNEINIKLSYFENNFYELKDSYFYSLISSSIKSLKIQNYKKSSINITFYLKDKSNNFKKLKTLNINKDKDSNKFILNQTFDDFKMSELRFFFKIDGLEKNSKLVVTLKNKYNLSNFKILDQHQNCYFVK